MEEETPKEPAVSRTTVTDVNQECSPSDYDRYIGMDASVLDGLDLPKRTRIIKPGMAITMDFLPHRLNFELDSSGKIARVKCG